MEADKGGWGGGLEGQADEVKVGLEVEMELADQKAMAESWSRQWRDLWVHQT